jgi:PAS domain S-box-containing protein
LQDSFNLLYRSSHLGVVIADEEKGIVDANDAFLRLVGHSRREMLEGEIDWWAMTPDDARPLDMNALEQLRQHGACVPYEKEYVLRDGSRVPFLIGAVRLKDAPLTWAAYTLDLSEQRKRLQAEQRARDLGAKTTLVNQLAHELNNPLAALTFILHLLCTRPDVATPETQKLLADASTQVERVSETVRALVCASDEGEPPGEGRPR